MCVGVSETYVLGIQNGCKQLELHQTPAAVLYPHVQVLYHDSRRPDAVTGWLLLSVLQLQKNHRRSFHNHGEGPYYHFRI